MEGRPVALAEGLRPTVRPEEGIGGLPDFGDQPLDDLVVRCGARLLADPLQALSGDLLHGDRRRCHGHNDEYSYTYSLADADEGEDDDHLRRQGPTGAGGSYRRPNCTLAALTAAGASEWRNSGASQSTPC